MQRHFLAAMTSIAASVTLLTACGKKEEAPPAPVAEAAKPAEPAGADPKLLIKAPWRAR